MYLGIVSRGTVTAPMMALAPHSPGQGVISASSGKMPDSTPTPKGIFFTRFGTMDNPKDIQQLFNAKPDSPVVFRDYGTPRSPRDMQPKIVQNITYELPKPLQYKAPQAPSNLPNQGVDVGFSKGIMPYNAQTPVSMGAWRPGPLGLGALGDTWDDILNALPATMTAAANVITAINQPVRQVTNAGIYPVGFQNGVPVYASTPAGVTPQYPYAMPSGLVLPSGVTPSSAYGQSVYGQSVYGSLPQSQIVPGMDNTSLLLLGGAGVLALILIMGK